jgi:hypothetical protein
MNTIGKIVKHLTDAKTLHQQADAQGITQAIRSLQAWQCKRLMVTHNDLWQQKRFNPAMRFFIDELYGPKDFSQRDQDIARVVPKMSKMVPEKALVSLESALHLNRLSFELDMQMAERLKGLEINRETYAAAYFNCQNHEQRIMQIGFIEALGKDLAEVVKIKGLSALLMLSRKPAKLAGVIALHEFLEMGYKAFKNLGDVNDFIHPIVHREKQIMHTLCCADTPNPLPVGV